MIRLRSGGGRWRRPEGLLKRTVQHSRLLGALLGKIAGDPLDQLIRDIVGSLVEAPRLDAARSPLPKRFEDQNSFFFVDLAPLVSNAS